MTDNTPAIGDNVSKGHNAQARSAVIRDCMRSIAKLVADRKEIGDEIRRIKNERIKGELGMKVSDFNIAYRLYELEGEDRDELLTTVRECFDALGVGEQLDWLQAAERQEGNGAAA